MFRWYFRRFLNIQLHRKDKTVWILRRLKNVRNIFQSRVFIIENPLFVETSKKLISKNSFLKSKFFEIFTTWNYIITRSFQNKRLISAICWEILWLIQFWGHRWGMNFYWEHSTLKVGTAFQIGPEVRDQLAPKRLVPESKTQSQGPSGLEIGDLLVPESRTTWSWSLGPFGPGVRIHLVLQSGTSWSQSPGPTGSLVRDQLVSETRTVGPGAHTDSLIT